MFSGIVEETGRVLELHLKEPLRLRVACQRVLEGTQLGDSIAVNGVCLTVDALDEGSFTVGLMPETLRRTNLGGLQVGDEVNLERSLRFDGRVGGHFVQGHVDATGTILDRWPDGGALWLKIGIPRDLARYVVPKGCIAVDGVSLTVVEALEDAFTVSLVYHTQQKVTLARKQVGELVNLEVDMLGKYVERLLQHQWSEARA